MAAKNRSNELKITRVYDAPVAMVWDAWTDPKKAAKWWGPRGFTITTHSKDLRPGGSWDYTMHGPDGTDYPNTTLYHEVEHHQRLVYDHGGHADRPPLFRVTVIFTAEKKDRTRMDMTMALATPEAAEETRKFVKKAGGESTWDRLDEYLNHEASGDERFVINRTFDAPIERMWTMWADPEHFSRWLAPKGFSMKLIRADIKPGGGMVWQMSNDAGTTMYGRSRYEVIERPHLLVYTQQFVDEKEQTTRHYASPTWPETMRTTVTFTDEGAERTRVRVKWEPVAPFTAQELETFVKARAGMTVGWTGSFDKLDAVLGNEE